MHGRCIEGTWKGHRGTQKGYGGVQRVPRKGTEDHERCMEGHGRYMEGAWREHREVWTAAEGVLEGA